MSLFSQFINWIKKIFGQISVPVITTTTSTMAIPITTTTTSTIALSGDLVDPPYTQAWMNQNGDYQEVGMEQTYKIIVRCCCYRPSVKGWWYLTTPFIGKVKRIGNTITCPDFTYEGYAYHVRGWITEEPKNGTPTPSLAYTGDTAPYGTKYMITEIRKAV